MKFFLTDIFKRDKPTIRRNKYMPVNDNNAKDDRSRSEVT
jgi:hypothetical protein